MKITGIECLPVHSGWRKNFVFVRIATDAEIELRRGRLLIVESPATLSR